MLKTSILIVHATLGVVVFLTGLLQIVLKKSGKWHRWLGQVYVWSWLGILVTGAYLGGLLITLLGVFGYYMCLTGSRFARLKQAKPVLFDKLIVITGLVTALIILASAGRLAWRGEQSWAIIAGFFGILFCFNTGTDFMTLVLDKPWQKNLYGKMNWFFEHFARMGISYIAALTAFASVQNIFGNVVLNFTMPTFIGAAIVHWAKKYYRKKFKLDQKVEKAEPKIVAY